MSYSLANKMGEKIMKSKNPGIAICDEAHYMKNPEAQRTKSLIPILKSRKRILLLTGTPALAKPKEIFTLCHIIRPDLFERFSTFANRYCDPRPSKFFRGISYEGSSNEKELNFILKRHIMVRR